MNKPKYKRDQPTLKNPNRICTICESDYKAISPLQKTCSEECRGKKDLENRKKYKGKYVNKHKEYNKNRIEKNPTYWRDKYRDERTEIINALGGECIVCGNKNPFHLHVDYKPTMQGTGFRHPRYKKWMLDNLKDFRVLCANHHYELTITGKIEGTNIIQNINDK